VTVALRLSTVGMGTDVGASVGVLGAAVSVDRGVKVNVKVGTGVKVSEERTLVDVFVGTGEEDAVGLPLLRLHARVVVIRRMSKYRFLIFIPSLY
jgi:hypothetical protein